MLQMSLSAKKSPLVNWNLLSVPNTSKKKGSLRPTGKESVISSLCHMRLSAFPSKPALLQR